MEVQEQVDEVAEVKISDLEAEDIAKRMVDCKVAAKELDAYYKDLEAEMVTRIKAGKVMDIAYDFTIHTGEIIRKTASIRHQHNVGLKYRDKHIIACLREEKIPYAETYINPPHTRTVTVEESLDQEAFETSLYTDDNLEPLRKLVTKTSKDWCVVTGVPK